MANLLDIRRAIEVRMASLPGSVKCAFEGEAYSPNVGTPWMEAFLLPATPQNRTMGAQGVVLEQGIFQVTVRYPTDTGTKDITTQAEAIRSHFPRGTSLSAGTETVVIANTPALSQVRNEADWQAIVVSIPYFCNRLT